MTHHPEQLKQYRCEKCGASWYMRTSQEILACPVCFTSNVFLPDTPRTGEPGGPTFKEAEK